MKMSLVCALRTCVAAVLVVGTATSGFGQSAPASAQPPIRIVLGSPAQSPGQTPPAQVPPPTQVPPVPAPPVTPPATQPGQPTPSQTAPSPPSEAPPIQEQRAPGPERKLTLDEAVQLALEQNLDVQVERINPQLQDLTIEQAESAWVPNLAGQLNFNDTTVPPDSLLAGADEVLQSQRLFGTAGVSQQLPFGGTSYSVGWDAARSESNNIFASFNPRLFSSLSFNVTQPLLRDFKIDGNRATLLVQKKNREISDVLLRQQIVSTVRSVKNAYWDLVAARFNLGVAQESLNLARRTLKDNRTRVEVGTMAPIDIVQAEAEVARNEESAIIAAAQIDQAEDILRRLVFDPKQPEFWTMNLEAIDAPVLPSDARDVDVEAAVQSALQRRTDLQQTRKQLETQDINIRYYRNQTLPALDAVVDYGLSGLGGVQVVRGPSPDPDNPFVPGPIIDQIEQGFGSVLGDLFGANFPQWTVGVQVSYPLGTSNADATLARGRLAYSQSELSLRSQELTVATEVRNVGRNVNTNRRRVESTRAAKALAERRLEAEEKKFAVGLSTSFEVFQAQRDLTQARTNELNAVLDYVQSLVDFEAVQEAGVGGGLASGPIPIAIGGAGTNTQR